MATIVWRTPEELLEIGFSRSRVVMINEAHSGLKRCIRTREIGQRVLPTAHRVGVRHLAMEALWLSQFAEEANHTRQVPERDTGYLSQPEMRTFIQIALDLGWTLIPYEANIHQQPPGLSQNDIRAINWREEVQARNLIHALQSLPPDTQLLVWCGNGHHTKVVVWHHLGRKWLPMGYQFKQLSGLDPFVIDQTVTVKFFQRPRHEQRALDKFASQLDALGGTAGFLRQEAPPFWADFGTDRADAFILSTRNELE